MRWPHKGRGPRPGGIGRGPLDNIASNSDDPQNNLPARRRSRRTPGLTRVGPVVAGIVADLKFQRQVERLHRLGARVVGELLAEIGAERSIQTIIDQKLDRYVELDPEILEATGGDDFWPAPIREV